MPGMGIRQRVGGDWGGGRTSPPSFPEYTSIQMSVLTSSLKTEYNNLFDKNHIRKFPISWLFSDRRQIFADNRTAYIVHYQKNLLRNYNKQLTYQNLGGKNLGKINFEIFSNSAFVEFFDSFEYKLNNILAMVQDVQSVEYNVQTFF